ncbi:hypothetical protein [Salibacterium aidingense]|nr:hypothetical protein [Salibacterium aidingense]
MSKKMLYALLTGVLTVSVLGACGDTEGEDPTMEEDPAMEEDMEG